MVEKAASLGISTKGWPNFIPSFVPCRS
jgi:hypothetical protein